MRPTALFLAAASAMVLAGCSQAPKLECPAPQLHAASGDLHETEADIGAFQARFEADYDANAISEAVGALRAKYPQADKAAIGNYLTAAYCPIAADSAMPLDKQKARLTSFERAVDNVLGI